MAEWPRDSALFGYKAVLKTEDGEVPIPFEISDELDDSKPAGVKVDVLLDRLRSMRANRDA